MALFGKKTETVSIPTDQVIKLRQQGLSDDQIVQTLQKDGFKSHQIFEAMNQAEVKGMVAPSSLEDQPEPENPMHPPAAPPRHGIVPQPELPPEAKMSVDRIEEIAEAIIDEKWNELVVNVNKIVDWKEEIDKKIASIDTKMHDISARFERIQSSMMGKIEEYDKTMTDVGTDVKALTKVFQKVLPGFIENVGELSRITDKMKGKSPKTEQEKPVKSTAEKKRSRTEEIFGPRS
jgi:hypothetical protein